jgi:hypothetical protein
MATSFKTKRFSAAMKKEAEDVYFKELAPKGEKFTAKVARVTRNSSRWVKHNPKKAATIAAGTTLAGLATAGAVKGIKKKKEEKTYSEEEGSGLGKKLLIGAGTLAAGIGAAKTGMLGKTAKLGINKAQFGLGKAVGSKGLMSNAVKGQREALGKVKPPKAPTLQTPTAPTQKALPAASDQKLLQA